jgi:cytidyltransferase-like protein
MVVNDSLNNHQIDTKTIKCENKVCTDTTATNAPNSINNPIIECSKEIPNRPRRTIYMDGVFDLFHIGHLEAIRHCAKLGDRVIIGITGDEDAAGYKRPPIICEKERIAIITALREVDAIVCPCPLVVTEKFMDDAGIDLVVHGFANDDDAKRQHVFFEPPMRLNKFQRIPYYSGQSTTDILKKIQCMSED